jgi:hypothetical protein
MTESAGTLVTLKFSIICALFISINGIILLIKHTVVDEKLHILPLGNLNFMMLGKYVYLVI